MMMDEYKWEPTQGQVTILVVTMCIVFGVASIGFLGMLFGWW